MTRVVNVYCDESRYSNEDDPYLVIGAVKCLREVKPQVVNAIKSLKAAHGIKGEVGWKTVSQSKGDFYKEFINWFLACNDVSFRCVVANKANLWSSDSEDGFYVVYNQLLSHWLVSGDVYSTYLDRKKNVNRRQVSILRKKTIMAMPKGARLACMEEVESHECVPIQLTDLLIGCVGYVWNDHLDHNRYPQASAFKAELCDYLAKGLGRSSLRFSTWASEPKFNVFWFGE